MTDGLHVERLASGASREAYLPLLLLADESTPLREYLNDGDLYVLRDQGGETLGVTLVIAHEAGTSELKNVAIAEGRQHRGLGKNMVHGVLDDLRARGIRRVIVGTSNAGIGEIAFYQKTGFRLWRIERDFFTPEKGYDPNDLENGLVPRDMVWFDQDLA